MADPENFSLTPCIFAKVWYNMIRSRLSRANRIRVLGPARWTRCLWPLGPSSEGPQVRPGLLGDSGPCPRPCGVNQMSQVTSARLRVPAGSTSCPRPLVLWSEGHRVDMVFQATRTVPEGPGIEQLSHATRAFVRGPLGKTSAPGNTGLCPRARGVDHLFRATQAGAPGPTRSTNSPGHLGFWSQVPR